MSNKAAYSVTMLNGMGYTSGKRRVNKGKTFDRYWDISSVRFSEEKLINEGQTLNGSTTLATQKQMHRIVLSTLDQSKAIANRLRGNTVEETLKNIARYFQDYYDYRQDHSSREQIRTPARAYADRLKGIDCDCFSTSVSSILLNLGIDHYWRKTKPSFYDADYSHIYVVVPKFKGADMTVRANYYVIDPVVTERYFDLEHTENQLPKYFEDYHVTTTPPKGMGGISLNIFKGESNTDDSEGQKILKYGAIAALSIGTLLLIMK